MSLFNAKRVGFLIPNSFWVWNRTSRDAELIRLRVGHVWALGERLSVKELTAADVYLSKVNFLLLQWSASKASLKSMIRSKNIHLFVSLKSNTFIDDPGKPPKRLWPRVEPKIFHSSLSHSLCTLKVANFIQFLLLNSHKFMAGYKSTKKLSKMTDRTVTIIGKFQVHHFKFSFLFYLFFASRLIDHNRKSISKLQQFNAQHKTFASKSGVRLFGVIIE